MLNRMRTIVQPGMNNIKNNEDIRSNRLENRNQLMSSTSSSTVPMPRGLGMPLNGDRFNNGTGTARLGEMGGRRPFATSTIGTSTPQRMFGGNFPMRGSQGTTSQYLNNGKAMRLEMFKMRKNDIVRQLETALNNLKQVRTRIGKATANGRDMTKATSLLTIADGKIAAAQTAVNSVMNLSATSSQTIITDSSATSTATTNAIDLNKPRKEAAGAIQSIKDAQKSLNDVVVAIAQSTGL